MLTMDGQEAVHGLTVVELGGLNNNNNNNNNNNKNNNAESSLGSGAAMRARGEDDNVATDPPGMTAEHEGDGALDASVIVDMAAPKAAAVAHTGMEKGVQGAWRAYYGFATAVVLLVGTVLCGAGIWVVTRSVHPLTLSLMPKPYAFAYALSTHPLRSLNSPSQYTHPSQRRDRSVSETGSGNLGFSEDEIVRKAIEREARVADLDREMRRLAAERDRIRNGD